MIRIITDTTACIDLNYAQAHRVSVIPQIITFGDDSFYEGIELNNSEFMDRLRKSSALPKTAAPPPELFRIEFEKLVPYGEPILCIHPSCEVSGTVRSASVAAQDFPTADIRIIDSRLLAAPLLAMVKTAISLAEAGIDIDTVERRVRSLIPRNRIYFMVDTLEYLAKGGRIGGASALLGNILQIKPILTVRDGRVEPFEKQRTHSRALARMIELTTEQFSGNGDGFLCVMHSDVKIEAEKLANYLSTCFELNDIPIIDLPPAIVVHGGPGILAISFFVSEDQHGAPGVLE
jgi:DegV family protein with EDD domain